MSVSLKVSIGEALDKLSILEIKKERIQDQQRLEHVNCELNTIRPVLDEYYHNNLNLYGLLKNVNTKIWHLSEVIRELSAKDPRTLEIYQEIFRQNEARFRIKNQLNLKNQSQLKEQKSYPAESIIILYGFWAPMEFMSARNKLLLASYYCDQLVIFCPTTITNQISQIFTDEPQIKVMSYPNEKEDVDLNKVIQIVDLSHEEFNLDRIEDSLNLKLKY